MGRGPVAGVFIESLGILRAERSGSTQPFSDLAIQLQER
jgi:hypothetical protein